MKYLFIFTLLLQPFLVAAQAVEVVESIAFGDYLSPLVKVKKDSKAFYYDLNGNHWIDDVEDHAANLFVVVKDGHYGVLKDNGDLVVPFEYDEINLATKYEGQWHEGKQYDYIYIVLKKDGKAGVADQNGKIVVPIQFQDAQVVNKNIVGVAENNVWGWATVKDGKVLQQPMYDYVTNFLSDEFVEMRTPDKSGLARIDGKMIIPVEYDDYLRYVIGGKQTYIEGSKGKQRFLMDTTGKVLLSGHADYKAIVDSECLIFKQDERYGVINPITQKVMVANEFEALPSWIRGLGIAKKAGKYGVIDMHGKILLGLDHEEVRFLTASGQPKYDGIPVIALTPPDQGRAVPEEVKKRMAYEAQIEQSPYLIEVVKNGQKGIYSWTGKTIVPMGKYNNVQLHYYNGKTFFLVESNQKMGIVDQNGSEILSPQYSRNDTYQYSKSAIESRLDLVNRFIVFSDGKEQGHYAQRIGLFDLDTRKVLIMPHEQDIRMLNDRFIVAKKLIKDYEYEFVLYDLERGGNRVFPPATVDVRLLSNRFFLLEAKDKSLQITDVDGRQMYANASWTSEGSYELIRFPAYKDSVKGDFYHGIKKIYSNEGNLFIDTLGKERRFDKVEQVDDFYDGYALAAKKIEDQESHSGFKYKRGMIGLDGRIVVPFEYNEVYTSGKDSELLIFLKEGAQMMVRRNGVTVLGPGYSDIESSSNYANFTFTKNGKYGLADWSGNILVQPLYDDIRRNYDDIEKTWPLLVKEGEWYYFVNKEGRKYPIKAKQKHY
ncbi:WG repeat-containing protein [Sphingobacterium sp. SYP-B4668]|uniref:WG repeat-containing protein n=1 Tax=Sphingobacterium sp. SYP-B4668 TaxID=2996035 RepID=UPI0022DE6CFA|nr:WG repeat-containing protein [Sphingobacterium sp. SYP-B4668]